MSRGHPKLERDDSETWDILVLRHYWFWQFAYEMHGTYFDLYMLPPWRPSTGGAPEPLSDKQVKAQRTQVADLFKGDQAKMQELYDKVDEETRRLWPHRPDLIQGTHWDQPVVRVKQEE